MIRLRYILLIISIAVSFLQSSCYCFLESTPANVRYMNKHNYFPLCEPWAIDGYNMQANAYYGFPNIDLNDYKDKYEPYAPAGFDRSAALGIFGFRLEKYVSPFGIIPNCILGLGLDYSFSRSDLEFKSVVSGSDYNNRLSFINNRCLFSMNLMTMVKGNWIGYTTLQGGLLFTRPISTGNDPYFAFNKSKSSSTFNYRIGYGFQRYLNNRFALTLEGGYGGGAYFKTGFCYWFKFKRSIIDEEGN